MTNYYPVKNNLQVYITLFVLDCVIELNDNKMCIIVMCSTKTKHIILPCHPTNQKQTSKIRESNLF